MSASDANKKALAAGAELNAAVAREVMGWRVVWVRGRDTGYFIGGHYPTRAACQRDCAMRDDNLRPVPRFETSPGYTNGGPEEWHPSTDIAAAWEVVEKMRSAGWSYMLRDEGGKHHAFFHLGFEAEAADADATAPLAICRAALAALRSAAPHPAPGEPGEARGGGA
jgi:hypothetical protein